MVEPAGFRGACADAEHSRSAAFENGTKRAHAPRLGEHTKEVLREHGYQEAEIAALIEKKVIAAL